MSADDSRSALNEQGSERSGHRRSSAGTDDSAEADGAALGLLGIGGWFTWHGRRGLRNGMRSVSAPTWRGTVNVPIWIACLVLIAVVGPILVPAPQLVWGVVALLTMIAVGRWWDRRPAPPSRRSLSGPHGPVH